MSLFLSVRFEGTGLNFNMSKAKTSLNKPNLANEIVLIELKIYLNFCPHIVLACCWLIGIYHLQSK